MSRTKLIDVGGLPDPLMQYNFDLFVPNVPGVTGFDARDFKTRVLTTSIPGRTIEPVEVSLHGVTIDYAGRVQYQRTLAFEMLETRNMKARDVLMAWHKFTRDNSSQGSYHAEYSTSADLRLYDDKDNIVRTIRLQNAWLESFDDSGLDGASSAAVQVSGSLRYFYYDDVNEV